MYVSQHLWPRLLKGLAWTTAWALIGYACLRFFGFHIASLIGLFVCLLLTLAGLFVVSFSARWNTVWFRRDTLKWREIRPFAWHTRSFPLLTIRDFGFAFFSHGGPVLRMDVDGIWYVFAEGIQEWEATALLREINGRGVVLPAGAERQKDATASIPKFWMLD